MLIYKKISIVTFVFLLVFSLSVSAVEIDISGQVYISNEEILLGKIAHITGENREKIEQIKSIELSSSPLPGYSKQLSRELIRLILKNKGYDIDNIKLNIPQVFQVTTRAKRISREKLIAFVDRYIMENISYPEEQIEIEIHSSIDEILIPDTDYELRIDSKREIKPGNNSFPVLIIIDGQKYKRVYLTARIKLIRNVYIAVRNLPRGSKLTREDFRLIQKEVDREINSYVTGWEEDFFQDKILVSSLQKGDILQERMLEKPFIINWGDKVKALIKVGKVEVTTVVSARGRGKIGDFITVENENTKHRFQAKVVNSHLVKVEN